MPSVLVTGAAGLLGGHVVALLSKAFDVIGCDRHPWWGDQPARMLIRDLLEPGAIADVVAAVNPALIIHCAALVDVDGCEQDPAGAFLCNTRMSGDLARAAPPRCLVVYISSDGLFRGDTANAEEDDVPEPATVYARAKLEGERLIQQATPHHLVVRTNFYGWSSGRKRTFGEWLYASLQTERAVRLFTDFWFTPIYVVDFVHRLKLLIERGARGVVHLGGRERLSKHDFGVLLARAAGFSTDVIVPWSLAKGGLAAPRPRDMSLSSARFERMTGVSVPRCADGLRRFLRDRERPLSRRVDELEEGFPGQAVVAPSAQTGV